MSSLLTPSETVSNPSTGVEQDQPLLFFDGVCGLCNHFVDFVIARDKSARFRFSPLQGSTAARLLTDADRENLKSVVLIYRGKTYRKSSAVVRVFWNLPGVWAIAGSLLWLVPKPLRDVGYAAVARIRYRVFGQKTTCRMPTPAERARFLD